MNNVDPIKSREKVKNICKYLKLTNERNYILFMLGIYSGLRISDILKLKVKDVRGKTHFLLKEKKTGKTQKGGCSSKMLCTLEPLPFCYSLLLS